VFRCHDEIVTSAPAFGRRLRLNGSERSTDGLAVLHPVAARRDSYRSSRLGIAAARVRV
jgi:hypothetical protein